MVDPREFERRDKDQLATQDSTGPRQEAAPDGKAIPPKRRPNLLLARFCRTLGRQKLTDVIQALFAVGLLVLTWVGYIYTVKPAFEKDSLQRQIDRLTESLNEYVDTTRPFVIGQFLGKVKSDADRYRCGPTVWDLSPPTLPPPQPKTGEKLIEANLGNHEFQLLDNDRRTLLIAAINDFMRYRYSDLSAFTTQLEIQHLSHLTGPLAGVSRSPNLFRFSQEEIQASEKAFQAFDQGMIALRANLLPNAGVQTIPPKACIDMGAIP